MITQMTESTKGEKRYYEVRLGGLGTLHHIEVSKSPKKGLERWICTCDGATINTNCQAIQEAKVLLGEGSTITFREITFPASDSIVRLFAVTDKLEKINKVTTYTLAQNKTGEWVCSCGREWFTQIGKKNCKHKKRMFDTITAGWARREIKQIFPDTWSVKLEYEGVEELTPRYQVALDNGDYTCDCPDYLRAKDAVASFVLPEACHHILELIAYREQTKGRTAEDAVGTTATGESAEEKPMEAKKEWMNAEVLKDDLLYVLLEKPPVGTEVLRVNVEKWSVNKVNKEPVLKTGTYVVTQKGGGMACSCPGYVNHKKPCRHIAMVIDVKHDISEKAKAQPMSIFDKVVLEKLQTPPDSVLEKDLKKMQTAYGELLDKMGNPVVADSVLDKMVNDVVSDRIANNSKDVDQIPMDTDLADLPKNSPSGRFRPTNKNGDAFPNDQYPPPMSMGTNPRNPALGSNLQVLKHRDPSNPAGVHSVPLAPQSSAASPEPPKEAKVQSGSLEEEGLLNRVVQSLADRTNCLGFFGPTHRACAVCFAKVQCKAYQRDVILPLVGEAMEALMSGQEANPV